MTITSSFSSETVAQIHNYFFKIWVMLSFCEYVCVCVCSDLQPTFLDYEVINKRKYYVNSGIQLPTDIFKTDNNKTMSYSSKYEYFKM